MKFYVKKSALSKCIQLARKIASTRKANSPYGLAVFESDDNKVQMAVTDGQIKMRQVIRDCKIENVGKVLVPMRRLCSLLAKSKGKEIEFEARNAYLRLKTESTESSEEDAPESKFFDEGEPGNVSLIEIDSTALSDALRRVVFAAGEDGNWRRLDVVKIFAGESFIEFSASDGHRLAIAKAIVTGSLKGEALIPADSARKIASILSALREDAQIGITEKVLYIASDEMAFTVERIFTDYPDFKSVIPQDNQNIITASADKLLKSLKSLPISLECAVTFDLSQNGVHIHPYGENDKTAQIEGEYSGETLSVSLNGRYLIEPLKVLSERQVRIAVKDKNSPLLITTEDGYQYIVMPIVEEEIRNEAVGNKTEQKEEQVVVEEATEK
jgi:DNA polymerase-3 subunit beta